MEGLSIILPNYNGKHLFEKYFLENLKVFNSLDIPYEIILVDDASKDDSVNYLKENFGSKINLIEKKENSGFSITCNIGINQAKYDKTLLLNTDVLLTRNYFESILKYFKKADTFGVMGRIIGMNDDIIQDAARLPKQSGLKIKPSNFFYAADIDFDTPTLYLSGAITLVNTEKLKKLGGFNEIFSPFYGEDFELSLRAWRMGWKCYYHHEAICRHEISGSTKNYQKKYWIKTIYFRNRYFAHYLHLNGIHLLFWHLQIIFSDVLPSIFSINRYKVKAYFNVWANKSKLNTQKKEFWELMNKNESQKSLQNVFLEIKDMLKNQEIIKL
jgi:GT2 family glycosyltransferase